MPVDAEIIGATVKVRVGRNARAMPVEASQRASPYTTAIVTISAFLEPSFAASWLLLTRFSRFSEELTVRER